MTTTILEAMAMDQAKRTLAELLNGLFAAMPRPDGKEYSNQQVADAICATKIVGTLSGSYIWQLRNGSKDNPTVRHLKGLAYFFQVPVTYFFDEDVTSRIDQKLAELSAERERMSEIIGGDVQLMAMRTGELSPTRRQQAIDLVDVIYQLELAERGTQSPE
jgi:transcriptional regulator with XRE-family HTH domain